MSGMIIVVSALSYPRFCLTTDQLVYWREANQLAIYKRSHILRRDHSNETSSAVLLHGTICVVGFEKIKLECLTAHNAMNGQLVGNETSVVV